MVKVAYYNSNRKYDKLLSLFIKNYVKKSVIEKDDDVLVLCIGKTGSGKSMLMLHAYEDYAGSLATIDYISFNRSNLADNLDNVKNVEVGFRFNGYDEANVSKRDATSKFNKALLDVYYAIRGLNIFHWWNNPSVDMIDKPFIKDRVTGLFLIVTHDVDRPRVYYYFEKNKLLQILDKYKNLDYQTLKKVRKKYALYKGWFKDYDGFLKKDYLDKKNPRMEEKLTQFKNDFGNKDNTVLVDLYGKSHDELFDSSYINVKAGYASSTLRKFRNEGVLLEGDHYVKLNNSIVKYTKDGLDVLLKKRADRISNGFKAMQKAREMRGMARTDKKLKEVEVK